MIKIIIKGRCPVLRHFRQAQKIYYDWISDIFRMPKVSFRYFSTKFQLPDTLIMGSCAVVQFGHLRDYWRIVSRNDTTKPILPKKPDMNPNPNPNVEKVCVSIAQDHVHVRASSSRSESQTPGDMTLHSSPSMRSRLCSEDSVFVALHPSSPRAMSDSLEWTAEDGPRTAGGLSPEARDTVQEPTSETVQVRRAKRPPVRRSKHRRTILLQFQFRRINLPRFLNRSSRPLLRSANRLLSS